MEFSLFFTRFTILAISIITTAVSAYHLPGAWAVSLFLLGAGLTLIGLYDLAQPLHSVRRNYPIIGRLRWILEEIRPEIRQYLIESEHDQTPFSRSKRSLVYARAKNAISERAFGTLVDVYQGFHQIGSLSHCDYTINKDTGKAIPPD